MASLVPERVSASPARSSPRPTTHDPAEAAIGFDDRYQTDNNSTTTISLSSSVRDYTFENRRRYHKFREGRYAFPNDEGDRKLHFAPIRDNPQNIIDLGTGTGIWCIDTWVPLNVKFLVDDAESPWIYITPTIKDFPTFI
ncbi:methyltransferase [Hyaloscypha sp. PMI_1271]|nr:methyltransferase [Hyaloscypha sp. PMI_1271]